MGDSLSHLDDLLTRAIVQVKGKEKFWIYLLARSLRGSEVISEV